MKIINIRETFLNIYGNIVNCLSVIYYRRNYVKRLKDFLSVHSASFEKGTDKKMFRFHKRLLVYRLFNTDE